MNCYDSPYCALRPFCAQAGLLSASRIVSMRATLIRRIVSSFFRNSIAAKVWPEEISIAFNNWTLRDHFMLTAQATRESAQP
jgi:hypothetical protein